MKWLTWRQHRSEALVAAVLLGLVVFILIGSGQELAATAQTLERSVFARQIDDYMTDLFVPFRLLPLLLGMFVGAPLLAREFEHGTHRLVWTQGISPLQWLATKVVLVGGAALLALGVLFCVMLWWNQPVEEVLGPWTTFEAQGPVTLAYGLFGLALGIALGALLRKTLPAMALTILIFLLIRGAVGLLRTVFWAPVSAAWNFGGEDPHARAWVLSEQILDQTGAPYFSVQTQPGEFTRVMEPCVDASKGTLYTCLHDNGFSVLRVFQPEDRFWLFQGIETAIFLALAAGLLALTFWWIWRLTRGRLSQLPTRPT